MAARVRLIRPSCWSSGQNVPETGGGCDGPLGMAREANADALVAKWRRGNLVCEGDPCERPMRRLRGKGAGGGRGGTGTSDTTLVPVLRAKRARPFVFIGGDGPQVVKTTARAAKEDGLAGAHERVQWPQASQSASAFWLEGRCWPLMTLDADARRRGAAPSGD